MDPPCNVLKSWVNDHTFCKGQLQLQQTFTPNRPHSRSTNFTMYCRIFFRTLFYQQFTGAFFSELVQLILPLDLVAMAVFVIPAAKNTLLLEHGISQLDCYSSSILYFSAVCNIIS